MWQANGGPDSVGHAAAGGGQQGGGGVRLRHRLQARPGRRYVEQKGGVHVGRTEVHTSGTGIEQQVPHVLVVFAVWWVSVPALLFGTVS